MKYILLTLLLLAGTSLFLSGCVLIWSDDVLVVTWLKTVDANDLDIIAEPNYLQIGSGKSKTKNNNVRVVAPWGIGETSEAPVMRSD